MAKALKNHEHKHVEAALMEVSPEHMQRFAALPVEIQRLLHRRIQLLLSHQDTPKSSKAPIRAVDPPPPLEVQGKDTDAMDLFSGVSMGSTLKSLQGTHEERALTHGSGSLKTSKFQRLPENNFSRGQFQDLGGGRLKLEITSLRETAFFSLGCAGVIFFFIALFNGAGILAVFLAMAAAYGFVSYGRTDDYLIVDPVKETIFNYREFSGKSELLPLITFPQIASLAVDGVLKQSKNSSWWEYQVVCITRDGDKKPLSDAKKVDFFEAYEFAHSLAYIFNLPFFDRGQPEAKIEVTGSGRRLEIAYKQ